MNQYMRFTIELRLLAMLRRIAKALERMNDLAEARDPVVPLRVARKTEISHPKVGEWNDRWERERAGYPQT